MKIKKSKERKIKKPIKKASVSDKGKVGKSGDAVEEIFGVHVISNADIENHFGTSEKESGSESKNTK